MAALDVRFDRSGIPYPAIHGWTETASRDLYDLLDELSGRGLKHVLCTDIGRDGAMTGPAVDLYAECVRRYPEVAFQASGGVRHAADLTALAGTGAASAIVGKALLDGRISDEEIKPFLRNE